MRATAMDLVSNKTKEMADESPTDELYIHYGQHRDVKVKVGSS